MENMENELTNQVENTEILEGVVESTEGSKAPIFIIGTIILGSLIAGGIMLYRKKHKVITLNNDDVCEKDEDSTINVEVEMDK